MAKPWWQVTLKQEVTVGNGHKQFQPSCQRSNCIVGNVRAKFWQGGRWYLWFCCSINHKCAKQKCRTIPLILGSGIRDNRKEKTGRLSKIITLQPSIWGCILLLTACEIAAVISISTRGGQATSLDTVGIRRYGFILEKPVKWMDTAVSLGTYHNTDWKGLINSENEVRWCLLGTLFSPPTQE